MSSFSLLSFSPDSRLFVVLLLLAPEFQEEAFSLLQMEAKAWESERASLAADVASLQAERDTLR